MLKESIPRIDEALSSEDQQTLAFLTVHPEDVSGGYDAEEYVGVGSWTLEDGSKGIAITYPDGNREVLSFRREKTTGRAVLEIVTDLDPSY
jgi:hypothetical protein